MYINFSHFTINKIKWEITYRFRSYLASDMMVVAAALNAWWHVFFFVVVEFIQLIAIWFPKWVHVLIIWNQKLRMKWIQKLLLFIDQAFETFYIYLFFIFCIWFEFSSCQRFIVIFFISMNLNFIFSWIRFALPKKTKRKTIREIGPYVNKRQLLTKTQ